MRVSGPSNASHVDFVLQARNEDLINFSVHVSLLCNYIMGLFQRLSLNLQLGLNVWDVVVSNHGGVQILQVDVEVLGYSRLLALWAW